MIAARFGVTLAANLLKSLLSLAGGILVARGLGSKDYGDLSFLLASFTAVHQLLEMGTSSAFYTFVSQRKRGRAFFLLYSGWMAFRFVATVLLVGLSFTLGLGERIWLGHNRGMVLLAFGASFLTTQGWGLVSHLAEARRKTVLIQAAGVLQGLIHLALIYGAVSQGWLTVQALLWLLVVEHLLLVGWLTPRLFWANLTEQGGSADSLKASVREFVTFCRPLVLYGCVGFLYAFADRWLLQRFGGAQQQGFFAVGQQFANVSLLATTSILAVFWKEIAEARERRDQQALLRLYSLMTRGLYLTTAWVSGLLLPYSREILLWTVGAGYEAAWPCLALLFLYPIHQSMGQMNSTYFVATGDTRSHTRIGMTMMALSLPVTYGILASPSAWIPGLGLAAGGLAVKMILLQIVGVNLQAAVIARKNGWAYRPEVQVTTVVSLAGLGWLCKWMSSQILGVPQGVDVSMGVLVLGSLGYLILSFGMIARVPELVGFTREEILAVMRGATGWLRPVVPQAPYSKYNSFVEIRHAEKPRPDLSNRLQRLQGRLSEIPMPEPMGAVVKKACEDLLTNGDAGKEAPRFSLHSYVTEEMDRLSDEEFPRYLFYRYRYEIYPQRKILDDFPPCLQIEPTSICNYRCVFCYQTDRSFTRKASGQMGTMSLALFKELIDQASGRCEAVTLASRGEPLLCPQIEEMLAYARGKFLALKINTNASTLDEKVCHAILQADPNTVVFSVDAASEPAYSRLRVGGRLERVRENIQRFHRIRTTIYPKGRLITRISGVHVPGTPDLKEMEQAWGQWVDQVAFVKYNPWENTYERPLHEMTTPCSDLWRRMFVWWDGTVNPCDVDYRSTLSVGTVPQKGLSEIWRSEAYTRLRENHLALQRSQCSPCNRCTVV